MENTRREFISKSAAATAGLTVGLHAFGSNQSHRIFGANDKIRIGLVGVGNRGSQLMNRFMANSDVEIAALCDVYKPYTERDRSMVSKRYLKTGKRLEWNPAKEEFINSREANKMLHYEYRKPWKLK